MAKGDCHVFRHADRWYGIDVHQCMAYVLNEMTNEDVGIPQPFFNNILSNSNSLSSNVPTEAGPSDCIPVSHIALFVTQNCNLNCIYCYGDGGQYGSSGSTSSVVARKSLDWLVDQSQDVEELHISFFGGEPLLNFRCIQETIDYSQSLAINRNKKFKFHITTNLILLDAEMIQYIKDNDIGITVSFDGCKEVQDKQRPFKGKKGSTYDATLPKIRMLLQHVPDVVCRATLCSNIDPRTVRNDLASLGFSYIHICPVSPSLFSNTDATRRSPSKILSLMEEDVEQFLILTKDRSDKNLKRMKREAGFLFAMLALFLSRKKRLFPCGAGRHYVAISNLGDIFLCHRFVGSVEQKLGNIWEGELARHVYQQSPISFINQCATCFARYQCAGRCYHENKASTGSPFSPSRFNCILVRRALELTAYISANLSFEDKIFLIKKRLMPSSAVNVSAALAHIHARRTEILSELKDINPKYNKLEILQIR